MAGHRAGHPSGARRRAIDPIARGRSRPDAVARTGGRGRSDSVAAKRALGREQLRPHIGKGGGKGELAMRLYKQATDKIIGISDAAENVLEACF